MTPLTTFGLLLMAFNIVYFAIYINRQIQAGEGPPQGNEGPPRSGGGEF